ncbi:MAG: autotransporter outer membrane beta-barrel domain-containing protein [Croceibacterium sp.]
MRRYLLASTAVLAFAAPAAATDITTAKTTPLQTSTVKNGVPDSITITSTGSVTVTAGTAVTMDDNHSVANQGKIAINNANDATGIAAAAGTTGDISNTGTITVDETYTPTDTDKDGDLDGPFALGSNRFGIRTLGDHTGDVVNNGTITVEGNDSAGIWLGGKLTGALTHNGTTTVLGDRAIGLQAQDITGNVRLAGTVSATGKDAIAARFSGDIGGALVVQGIITSTGYRYTAPTDTSKLDADDLLQGGSALIVEGNVAGGIILAVPPKDNSPTNNDEDADGIEDSKEGSANVNSYGAAPAMLIGATDHAIAIGPMAGTASHYGLQIDGAIGGQGVIAGINATALQIGGRGGAVTIANGIGISGTVSAVSNAASATAVLLGSGTTTPEIQNTGTITASGGNAGTAIVVDTGASLGSILNSGTIKAAAGESGTATAILDKTGGVTLLQNSGAITATGAKADSTRNVAIDLSANTTGVTVKQTQVGSGFAAPSIAGDIRLGSGDDLLSIADGTFKGTAYFGAGDNTYALAGDAIHTGSAIFGAGNDAMTLAGTSQFVGTADFTGGGADTLSLSGSAIFKGALANSTNLAVSVAGGTLDIARPVSIASLSVGAGGTLVATLDKTAGSGTAYNVSGTASFGSGAKLSLRLANVHDAVGSFTILQAGSLQGASGISLDQSLIPFLFKTTLASNAAPNQIKIDVARKSAQDLGLNRSQASAYDAIFAALGKDSQIDGVFLGITDGAAFRSQVAQMLPDHAGGSFEGVSEGIRSFARQVADPVGPVYSVGGVDILLSMGGWGADKGVGNTASYHIEGMGFSGGAEIDTSVGSLGATATYLYNSYNQKSASDSVQSDTYELAAYWRGSWGGFTAYARGSAGTGNFRGDRSFTGLNGSDVIKKTSHAQRNGSLVSASGGISYEGGSTHFFIRPSATIDYLRIKEDGYTEAGGGAALDLIVDPRTSDELAVNGGLALGIDFTGQERHDENWFRIETEGGWRENVGGALDATTAHFANGTPFTLEAEQEKSGWYARLRALGGTDGFRLSGEAGAEQRLGGTAFSLRGNLAFRW